jgi:hypothetical protein
VGIEVIHYGIDPLGGRVDLGLDPAQKINPIGSGAALVGCDQGRSRGRLEGAEHIAGDTPPAIVDLLGGPFCLSCPPRRWPG